MAPMNSVKKIMNKVKNFLDSPSGKKKTGQFLDKTERFATGKLGADKASKIRQARTMVEGRLDTGSPRPKQPGSTQPNLSDRSINPDEQPGAGGGEGYPRP